MSELPRRGEEYRVRTGKVRSYRFVPDNPDIHSRPCISDTIFVLHPNLVIAERMSEVHCVRGRR